MHQTHPQSVILRRILSHKVMIIIVLVLCSIPVWWNLLRPGMPITDDGDWMLIRFSAFHQELRSGQFPVRWLNRLNSGYGYPVVTFLYPGFLYLAEIPKVLGFGFVNSIKILIIGCLIAGGLITYINLRRPFGQLLAFFGGLYYLYQPYILWDVYKRGSVGELLFFAILPFMWWTIERKRHWLTSIGYAALILAHNSLALLFIPFLLIYQMIDHGKLKPVRLLTHLGIGISLSAFFWLPAIVELPYTIFRKTIVSNWSAYFMNSGLFYLIAWSIGILLVIVLIRYRKFVLPVKYAYFAAITAVGIFLTFSLSSFLWKFLPLGSIVQFPFRFASIAAFTTPYLAVFAVSSMAKKWQAISAFLLLIVLMCTSIVFLLPQELVDKGEGFYATNESTSTTSDEYMPAWVTVKPTARPAARFERIDGQTVQINTIYWPGFHAVSNGVELPITYDNERGLMRVTTTVSVSNIHMTFKETPLRLFADGLSIAAGLIVLVVWKKRYV